MERCNLTVGSLKFDLEQCDLPKGDEKSPPRQWGETFIPTLYIIE